jgi:Cholesterol oxidase, substrate-binding
VVHRQPLAEDLERLTYYQGLGQFPMNRTIEIRVTGLDQPSEVAVSGAQSPILSSLRPRPDHPQWDTATWLDMGTLPVTAGFSQFYADVEAWIWSHYSGSYATVAPGWSKAWACTAVRRGPMRPFSAARSRSAPAREALSAAAAGRPVRDGY